MAIAAIGSIAVVVVVPVVATIPQGFNPLFDIGLNGILQ